MEGEHRISHDEHQQRLVAYGKQRFSEKQRQAVMGRADAVAYHRQLKEAELTWACIACRPAPEEKEEVSWLNSLGRT